MAYLDVRDAAQASSYASSAIGAVEPVGFTRREWQVIVLAQRDGLASLRAPGRVARLMGRLFGESANPRLADPRLEALRRLAVLAWQHGYAVPVSAIKATKAFGFTGDQIELLLASIANGRSGAAPNSRRFAALA